MVSLVALVVWRRQILIVVAGFLVFGCLDGLYLSSALTKVPDGAWFTLCLAVLLSSIFLLWRFGKENQWQAEASDRIPPWQLLVESKTVDEPDAIPNIRLTPSLGGGLVTGLHGMGVFFDKTGSHNGTPTVFIHFLQKFQAAPAITVFFHVRPLSTPSVASEDRFSVSRCHTGPGALTNYSNFYRVTIRHGYADTVISSDLGLLIYESLRNFIIHEKSGDSSTTQNGNADHAHRDEKQELVRDRLNFLQSAYDDQVVHVVGKEQMRIGEARNVGGFFRRVALAAFLWLRSNTGSKVANMNLDVEKLVDIGFVKVI